MPHHVTHGEGSFALGWRTPINLVDTQPSALLYAQMLRQAVEEFTGLRLRLLRGCAHSGEITLTQDSSLRRASPCVAAVTRRCFTAS